MLHGGKWHAEKLKAMNMHALNFKWCAQRV